MHHSALRAAIPLLVVATPLFIGASASQGFLVHTGSPVTDTSYTRHVQGQEVSVYEMTSALHEMNRRGAHQPTDLQLRFAVAEDPSSGHAAYCRAAFAQVYADQRGGASSWSKPFLQINIDLGSSEIQTDEGDTLYADEAVNCWESLDPR